MKETLKPGIHYQHQFEVTARVELIEVDGRRLLFTVEAHDGVEVISRGRHERFVINKEKFDAKVGEKRKSFNPEPNATLTIIQHWQTR
ncbi:MAG: hypothetical protein Q8O38_11760 [Sulfurimicrobium sp.]|nr:hypothetical protein [Sulfurimicrobium sp.]